MFKGKSYDEGFDFNRLKNNTQRVFTIMLDGMWHCPDELRDVGGSNWGARVRQLREPQLGSMKVDVERHGSGGKFLYRLDLDTVTEEIKERIRKWDLPRPVAPPAEERDEWHRCPACNGTGVMTKSVSKEQLTLF